ncbi:MAG: DUF2599 domain-containing protein [Bifidobacteriaceae bacterium]|jgi:hypothetical protein|nr:DUF2599 domain-containing protein [Bifidobacteriaceae bacterium]
MTNPYRRPSKAILATALSAAILMAATPAYAGTPEPEGVGIAEALDQVVPDQEFNVIAVLDDVADIPTDSTGSTAVEAELNGVEITVPVDPADALTVEGADGLGVAVDLPFSSTAEHADVVDTGIVAYDNGNGSTTVPAVKEDGSVQIATVIEDSGAPTSYDYGFETNGATNISVLDDGSVIAVSATGELVFGLLAPWAQDADGQPVPTRFEIEDDAIVQIVDHTSQDVAYPVVADPYLFVDLFSKVTKTNKGSGKFVISAKLSAWGQLIERTWVVLPSGLGVMVGTGWAEVVSKQPSANTTVMLQQHQCHALYGWTLGYKDTWDYESWRSSTWNVATWTKKLCNW